MFYRPAGAGRSAAPKRFKLGTPSTIPTASDARRLARDMLGRVARGEDPAAIIEQIRSAAPAAQVITDRGEAIARTIAAATSTDVVLLAGKGHEPYQEIAGVRRPFSDVAQARSALADRLQRSCP